MRSLQARLLLGAAVALTAFLGITGFALDEAFRSSAEAALRERLQAQVYALLAAADVGLDGIMHVPVMLPEARFQRPGSGLYARVIDAAGRTAWRSSSALGQEVPFQGAVAPGAQRFEQVQTANGSALYELDFGVSWDTGVGTPAAYTFSVAEDLQGLHAQVTRFRRSLWGWFGAVALVLLAVQGSVLRWSLAPLRGVERDLAAIEAGAHAQLHGVYPRELQGLTSALNALLQRERSQLARYRDALADLAHSLKTPLAVLRGSVQEPRPPAQLADTVQEQVERMGQIVDYQLQRAATSGRTTLMAPVHLAPLVERVVRALGKVYADKQVECTVAVDAGVVFPGDEGDLLELLGNVIDNAFKWCRHRVQVTVRPAAGPGPRALELEVQDDGPGVPPDQARRVLERGMRADAAVSGHGIGLAVAQEIARAYQGSLDIATGSLGGARVRALLAVP